MPLRPAAACAALALAMLTLAVPPGQAQVEPLPPAAEPTPETVSEQPIAMPPAPVLRSPAPLRGSIGYLAGNGIGELGAELGFRAWPHVGFGLQLGRIAGTAGNGFGLAPVARLSLTPDGGAYATLGATWFNFSTDATTRVSGNGLLAGFGYEWRPVAQFALLGGVGVAWVPATTIDRAGATSSAPGGLKPNFEVGARWYAF